MPFNDAAKNAMLDALDEGVSQITHIGAHTLTDPGTGTNANSGEVAGGSYARQAVTFGAAASAAKANTGALSIPIPAGTTVGFLTGFNHVSANSGNYRGYFPLNGTKRGFGTVDSAGVTSDAIQSAGHGLIDTNRVMVMNTLAESLPTGLTEGTIYFVVSAATDTFELSLTSGGASVNITAQGELYWQDLVPETFASAGNLTVDVGALILDAVVV